MSTRFRWALMLLSGLALASACGGRRGGGGGDDDADDDDTVGPSDEDRQALEGFLDAYPSAYCEWAVECDFVSAGEEAACVDDIADEIGEVEICDGLVEQFASNRSAIEDCVSGEAGACGERDDDFCPALADVDVEHACEAEPECTVPDDCDDGENCVDGRCTVTGGELTLEQAAVGVWSGSGTCDGTPIQVGWFLCPGGRLRGFTTIGDYDFLDCGTWAVVGDRVEGTVTNTAVIDGSTDSYDFVLQYDGERMYWGSCVLPLDRLPGAVDEAECTGGTCSAGGSGDVDCDIDCDCGRCWYCESGTCRYAGEGPYGCYRGCGL